MGKWFTAMMALMLFLLLQVSGYMSYVPENPELAASLNQSYAQHYVDNIPVYRETDKNPGNTTHCCYPEASQD